MWLTVTYQILVLLTTHLVHDIGHELNSPGNKPTLLFGLAFYS